MGVQSLAGIGSVFWFDIKFEKPVREKRVTAPLTLGPVNLTQTRILIVDDNETNRVILTKSAEALGSRANAVSSGGLALESLRNAQRAGDPYHVVLLDMEMPGMDGEQTARAIKSDPGTKYTKIIILTSIGQRGFASHLESLGCSGYLVKPVKQQMLFDAVIAALGRDERYPGFITQDSLSEQRKPGLPILLAEDNPINQKLAVVLLQKAGYSVDAVENGLQAFEKAKANPYSAILMDVQMPEMDGLESTRRIRALEQNNGRHVPIIAITAHALRGDRERFLSAGMDDHITKPLEAKILLSVLERWTQGSLETQPSIKPVQDYSSYELALPVMTAGLFGDPGTTVSRHNDETVLTAPVVSPVETLPVNFESALHRFSGDREFMVTSLRQYREQLQARVIEIHGAVKNGDTNRLARLAHNLKGVSLNLSVNRLAALALKLEEAGIGENLSNAPALAAQLEEEARQVEEYLLKNGL
jgi:CheY-like chemotaxis protein/HPt (histidine-containing phosphotransfer) domain-containing protein